MHQKEKKKGTEETLKIALTETLPKLHSDPNYRARKLKNTKQDQRQKLHLSLSLANYRKSKVNKIPWEFPSRLRANKPDECP